MTTSGHLSSPQKQDDFCVQVVVQEPLPCVSRTGRGKGTSGTLAPGGQGNPSHRRMSTRVSNLIVSEHSSGHSCLFS